MRQRIAGRQAMGVYLYNLLWLADFEGKYIFGTGCPETQACAPS